MADFNSAAVSVAFLNTKLPADSQLTGADLDKVKQKAPRVRGNLGFSLFFRWFSLVFPFSVIFLGVRARGDLMTIFLV